MLSGEGPNFGKEFLFHGLQQWGIYPPTSTAKRGIYPAYSGDRSAWDKSPMEKPDLATVRAAIDRGLRKSGLSASGLDRRIAKLKGRETSTLVKDIRGPKSKNPTLESIGLIAEALGTSIDEFLGVGTVPVVGFVGAGGEIAFNDDFQKGDGLYHVDPMPDMPSGMIGLEVRGDSMLPLFRDGYVAFILRRQDGVENGALRDWAVARLTDGRTLLKQIRRSAQPGKFDLLSLNADPIEGVDLLWATPVQGWRTRTEA